jgi:hypothetical protein
MNNESTPFSGLSPDLVLDAVEVLGLDIPTVACLR